MRGFVSLVVLFAQALLLVQADYEYEEKFTSQFIDHFNYLGFNGAGSTFLQRYLVTEKFWDGHGPIFFYTGNEGSIDQFWNNTGFMFEAAKEFRALVVFAEHRYYGKSLPFGQDSFSQKNIGYLSIHQALADFANLTVQLKKTYSCPLCKVVVFGGSYGGILSAYLRYKYPHLVDAAVAASAPVFLYGQDRVMEKVFKATTETYGYSDSHCPVNIRKAFLIVEELLSSPTGNDTLAKVFQLCSLPGTADGKNQMLGWLRNALFTMAMVDYPYPASFMGSLPAFPVREVCRRVTSGQDLLLSFSSGIRLFYGDANDCHDIYKEFIQCADPSGCGLGNDATAWDFQSCTELVLFGGSTGRTDMFPEMPFDPDMKLKYCSKVWGIQNLRSDSTPMLFWNTEEDVKKASNIIFSNGNLDPWTAGGVRYNLSSTLVSILIEDGAHHLDLRGSDPADPESVKVARKTEMQLLLAWLYGKKSASSRLS